MNYYKHTVRAISQLSEVQKGEWGCHLEDVETTQTGEVEWNSQTVRPGFQSVHAGSVCSHTVRSFVCLAWLYSEKENPNWSVKEAVNIHVTEYYVVTKM